MLKANIVNLKKHHKNEEFVLNYIIEIAKSFDKWNDVYLALFMVKRDILLWGWLGEGIKGELIMGLHLILF